ncbi:MAG: ATPase AAA [Rhodomicrobium sp.]|nr:MAG: ATPase AAA [Rhodomicrobium sp.]
MYANVKTVAFIGIEAREVDVQVQVASGLPAFTIVGLADKAVAESRERVRAALNALGLGLPPKRITVNLAPADLPKVGSHYDLAIALGLMAATGAITSDMLAGYTVIGELALDASISPVVGALPAAIGANAAGRGLICPAACGAEAAWASEDMDILASPHLLNLVNHFKGTQALSRPEPAVAKQTKTIDASPDIADIKGQEGAKRALEIAAAGGHNLLMVGPPGAGKTMLASRLGTILPALSPAEMLEVSMIQSLAGELMGGELSRNRPFRAPHHSATMASLVGGGSKPRPGEVALAHHGVLFLDELPEFSSQVLDSLRQPLESGETVIARANHRITYPSKIQLIAAMNPCRCGKAYEPGYACSRGANCAERYQSRISGPLLDRIDLHIEVPAVTALDLLDDQPVESSADIRERVCTARAIQAERFKTIANDPGMLNATCSAALIEEIIRPSEEGKALLKDAATKLQLSARGFHKALRVARTLADLEGRGDVARSHIAEALSYRGEAQRPGNKASASAQSPQNQLKC